MICKIFGYIDDGINYLIVNVFEKLPYYVNVIILALVLLIINIIYKNTWGERK